MAGAQLGVSHSPFATRQTGRLDDQQHLAPISSWWLCGGVVGLGACEQDQMLVRFLTYPPTTQDPSSRVRRSHTHVAETGA